MQDQEILLARKAYYSVGLASEASPYGTGSNLEVEVRLSGQINPSDHLVVNLSQVKLVLEALGECIDHRHFQFDVPNFSGDPASLDDVAKYCWAFLEPRLKFPKAQLEALELRLSDNRAVEINRSLPGDLE